MGISEFDKNILNDKITKEFSMKLTFSEYKSDYDNYIFPYVIWAEPESHEPAADLFGQGFLPNTHDLSRFYMCRHVRVDLNDYQPSSENRRILRKGNGVAFEIYPRKDFQYTRAWQNFCLYYADKKFGKGVMTKQRLDSVFSSSVCSHCAVFTDKPSGEHIGLVVLFLHQPDVAFYYYSFYDLGYVQKSLGMIMMTFLVGQMKKDGYDYIYLGSCYDRRALYKTQFEGMQFWNGRQWSDNKDELKYLIDRDQGQMTKHLLEDEYYVKHF